MMWRRSFILAIVLLPGPAGATPEPPGATPAPPGPTPGTRLVPSWAVAAGPGLVVGEGVLPTAHLRLGPEWVPERGLGVGLDAGWLCAAPVPVIGVVTVSPTVIYALGRGKDPAVSLRAGYTALVGLREPVVHAGVAFDQDLGRGRLRLELRDHVFVGSGSVHAFELTVGWVTP